MSKTILELANYPHLLRLCSYTALVPVSFVFAACYKMCTSILKGLTLSILQPTPKVRMQFSVQQCCVGCILIPCIDKVDSSSAHVYQVLSIPFGGMFGLLADNTPGGSLWTFGMFNITPLLRHL